MKDAGVVTTGPMVQIYLIGKELKCRGWRVSHVVTTRNIDKVGKIENIDGMHIHYVRHHRFGELAIIGVFLRTLHKVDADVYYQRGRAPMTGLTAYCARKKVKKFIWSSAGEKGMAKGKYVHEQLKKKKGIRKVLLYPYYKLWDRMYEYGITKADMVFAQTEYQLLELKKAFHRNGVILSSGHPVPGKHVLQKPNPPVILWIGAVKRVKQPELFFELARRLHSENAQFVMIGRLVDMRYRNTLYHHMKKQDNFSYQKEVPFETVSEWFAKASILVNTTLKDYEGLPNVFIQGWLHGASVVSLYCDPDNIVKKNALGFQVSDFSELAEKIRTLIRDADLRREMGSRARAYAVKNFGIEALVDQFVEVVRNGYPKIH